MPIGKLSEADRTRLYSHFWPIVERACLKNECWPGEVLNDGKKRSGVAQARAEIARELRDTTFTYYAGNGCCRLVLGDDDAGPWFDKLKPVSFPLLSKVLGVKHTTLVKALQKLKRQEKADGKVST